MALIGDLVNLQNMNMKTSNETRHLIHLVDIKDIGHYPNYHKMCLFRLVTLYFYTSTCYMYNLKKVANESSNLQTLIIS